MAESTSRCPSCASATPIGASFCPSCGGALSSVSQMPTNVATPSVAEAMRRRGGTPSTVGRLSSSDSIDAGAFAPGTVLAERYRIIGLVGRGGMGVVYRADDLKLGQPVALKFLPPEFAEDPVRRERFFSEVRIARQVSHPNVCRVYDVGEIDGQHYLSMEYVDGEDLASLLRRIGRLPNDKALEIARQLCAGLAAAHERGVMHRDLKPSNIMLDGRGRARITDFGLAAAAGDSVAGEVAGTPAYMAPEQLAGQPASVRSDLYALGLVLYELWTGRRAFSGASLEELRTKREAGSPPEMKEKARDVDPAVDRIVVQCLEPDPGKRPASAMQIAAALPGGDPLAAALAAGETPSPETVAEAGGEGAIEPRRAWAMLGGIIAAIVGVALLMPAATDFGLAPLPKSTEILEDRAGQIAAKLGYTGTPADSVVGWRRDDDQEKELAERRPSTKARKELKDTRPSLWRFWYRGSPRPLVPVDIGSGVTTTDPPMEVSGMVVVELDAGGNLTRFQAVPPQVEASKGPWPDPDWRQLLLEAGLDPTGLTPSEPRWVPPTAFDARAEWNGTLGGPPGAPIHVVAATFHGRPVYFDALGSWSRPERMETTPKTTKEIVIGGFFILAFIAVMVGCALLARRNVRLQRGDRRGAWVLVIAILVAAVLNFLFAAHHVADAAELLMFLLGFGISVFGAALAWVMYMALEPFVRKRAPEILISWGRLVAGRIRDPLVGRDLLGGLGVGALLAMLTYLAEALPTWAEIWGVTPASDAAEGRYLLGGRQLLHMVVSTANAAALTALLILSLYTLARILTRRRWLSCVIVAIFPLALCFTEENLVYDLLLGLAVATLVVVVMLRCGLVGLIAAWFGWLLLMDAEPTFDLSRWYAGRGWFLVLIFVALAVWAFSTALGKRSAFGGVRLEDA
jgi:predicted Ser/Thr protein kinase